MTDLYLDHNISKRLADLLRDAAYRVVTTPEVGMDDAGDERQLLLAAARGWVFITHNIKDYYLVHDAWLLWSDAWGVSPVHAGILIIPDAPAGLPMLREIDAFLAQGLPLRNELYEWKLDGGFRRRPWAGRLV